MHTVYNLLLYRAQSHVHCRTSYQNLTCNMQDSNEQTNETTESTAARSMREMYHRHGMIGVAQVFTRGVLGPRIIRTNI